MKTALLLLLSVLSLSALSAPVVEVISATSVKVDGSDFGKPADAIRNNPQLASPIQIALEKWANDLAASAKAASDEQARLLAVAETVKSAATVEEAKAAAIAATKPKEDRELAELKAKKAELEAQIAAREGKTIAAPARK